MTELRPETLVVAAGRPAAAPGAPLAEPVSFSANYHHGGAYAYGRTGNPTWLAFEDAVGALEGGGAVAFSSGMAAATTLLETLPLGARVVGPTSGYFEVRAFLTDRGELGRYDPVLVDLTDTEATLAACRGAALLWVETPTNPLLGIADLQALIAGAHDLGARVVVDNTFATPVLQRPLDLGADAVLHSVTKFLGGHGDLLMGVLVTRDAAFREELAQRRALYGGVPGPMDAYLALRGLRTLVLRVERCQENAMVLARRLEEHPAVESVLYPGLASHPGHELARRQMSGFGALVSFEVRGGADAADRVCESVRVIAHATSLGGIESLMERRTRWPGEVVMGTPPGLVRLSVGIEHVEDLWSDLEQALADSR